MDSVLECSWELGNTSGNWRSSLQNVAKSEGRTLTGRKLNRKSPRALSEENATYLGVVESRVGNDQQFPHCRNHLAFSAAGFDRGATAVRLRRTCRLSAQPIAPSNVVLLVVIPGPDQESPSE